MPGDPLSPASGERAHRVGGEIAEAHELFGNLRSDRSAEHRRSSGDRQLAEKPGVDCLEEVGDDHPPFVVLLPRSLCPAVDEEMRNLLSRPLQFSGRHQEHLGSRGVLFARSRARQGPQVISELLGQILAVGAHAARTA